MSYNTKNYTEQGGEKTVIGGELEVKEGARVIGLLSAQAEKQDASTATTVADLKADFNALILKLKNAGIMVPDTFDISVKAIPTKTEADLEFNHGKVKSITFEDNTVTVTAPVAELKAFPSSNPEQGTHKWLGLCFTTGLASIIGAYFNETYAFAEADMTEATTCGGTAGDFVLWIKTEEIAAAPRVIAISKPGYKPEIITIRVIDEA